jgi:Protein of unknown function (DUF3180)
MGPTRKRDLVIAAVVAAAVGYPLVVALYQWFPPITLFTGVSLLVVGAAEAVWAFYVRSKINNAQVGVAEGLLHPLTVARSVWVAKASAWVGAVMLGWWLAVLVYVLPRRSWLHVAERDTSGAVVAGVSALALTIAALWLQHCCEKPEEPPEAPNGAAE